jgi:hypothetical protein
MYICISITCARLVFGFLCLVLEYIEGMVMEYRMRKREREREREREGSVVYNDVFSAV